MPTRADVSAVPHQGGYIAKYCPARAQYDVLKPAALLEPSAAVQRRMDRGNAFEADVVAALTDLHPEAVTIGGDDSAERERATVAAMEAQASLILNSRLPADETGRRVGKPDLLVKAALGGYRAIDIKHHLTLEPGEGARTSALDQLGLEQATADDATQGRKHKGDLLQLAHYQRMLEAAGFAARDGRHGGIIGVERSVVWHDLDEPRWNTPSSTGKQKKRSTMEIYDFEFDFRLDIMAVAERHLIEPSTDLLVIPFRKPECDACPWWGFCRPQLETGSGHPSLIPRMKWEHWVAHRDRGVTDRAALAALDPLTARLVSAGVRLDDVMPIARDLPVDTPLANIAPLGKRRKQLQTLEAEGVTTARQLAALDERTASYPAMSGLAEQVDCARAALGSEPVYRRRGVERVTVPRGDVEIDVDMENVEDGVYLWGVLVADGYRPFVTWALEPASEIEVFRAFWAWLMDQRANARTFRAYCWHEQAENLQMRRIGAAAGLTDEVEAFIGSDEWVDLRKVFDGQLISGQGSGLKSVAPLAGFAWDVDEPGGDESMVRYDLAAGGDEGARAWLLDYNRGDVEATRAIRAWMRARAFPALS